MAMLLGPSLAGILSTAMISGSAGLRGLLSRLLNWKAKNRWYFVALLTAPLSSVFVIFAFSFSSPEFTLNFFTADNKVALILISIGGGLMVGFCEELGWTGFAIPRMRLRYGILTSGLILGLLWGLWHFLMFWENDSFSSEFPLILLLVRLFSWLPAYRILMVWIYDCTESLIIVMLMHVSLVFTSTIINPSISGTALLIFILVRAIVLWIFVAVVITANRKQSEKRSTDHIL